MNGSSHPEATVDFSARALFQLHGALHHYLATPTGQIDEAVTAAVEVLCREAHQRGFGPEKMLASLQSVWPMLILQTNWSNEESRILYERIAKDCIRTYFDSRPAGD